MKYNWISDLSYAWIHKLLCFQAINHHIHLQMGVSSFFFSSIRSGIKNETFVIICLCVAHFAANDEAKSYGASSSSSSFISRSCHWIFLSLFSSYLSILTIDRFVNIVLIQYTRFDPLHEQLCFTFVSSNMENFTCDWFFFFIMDTHKNEDHWAKPKSAVDFQSIFPSKGIYHVKWDSFRFYANFRHIWLCFFFFFLWNKLSIFNRFIAFCLIANIILNSDAFERTAIIL